MFRHALVGFCLLIFLFNFLPNTHAKDNCLTERPVHNAASWAVVKGPLRPLWDAWKADEAAKGRIWDDGGHLTNINANIIASGTFRADVVPPSAISYMVSKGGEMDMLVAPDAGTAAEMAALERERVRAAQAELDAQQNQNNGSSQDDKKGDDDDDDDDDDNKGDDDDDDDDDDDNGSNIDEPSDPSDSSEPVPNLNPSADLGDRANLKYGQEHDRQVLDLYLPKGHDTKNGNAPLVIFFHGGGFYRGDKKDVKDMLPLLDEGYAIASCNYRLLGKNAVSGGNIMKNLSDIAKAGFDARKAVRWLRDNAPKYGLNAKKFAAAGASAGGYLATVVGAGSDKGTLNGEKPGSSTSPAVKAVIDWAGPTNFATWMRHIGGSQPFPDGMATAYLNAQGAVSPYDLVSGGDPPHMIRHGEKDEVVPCPQSTEYAAKLKKSGVKCDLKTYPNMGHAPDKSFLDVEIKAIAKFLKANL